MHLLWRVEYPSLDLQHPHKKSGITKKSFQGQERLTSYCIIIQRGPMNNPLPPPSCQGCWMISTTWEGVFTYSTQSPVTEFTKSLSSRYNNLCRRGGGKRLRARDGGLLNDSKETASSRHTHTHELTETVTTCTGPADVQARWWSSTERETWAQDLAPKKLFVINTHWQRGD